ncbi:MAG: NAD(P)-binding domain-containing protein [Gammaproteobacteria bacterium]|nr:NAD(P)-binding domain-containing protein [Gammaproteobacteria bacterium]
MNNPIIMIGAGEMGGVFARGLLKSGKPIYPVTRNMDMEQVAREIPEPEAVLVTVAEKDIDDVLGRIPAAWRDRLILLQNELLPRDWQKHEIRNVTVISVWFEKKPAQDYKVLISSPVFGPHAELVKTALTALNIPCHIVESCEALAFELVLKNVYILTTNIAGLECGGTVSELWRDHEKFTRKIAGDVMDIQDWLMNTKMDREALIKGMLKAFDGDPDHKCMGRSAPARLARALETADEAGLAVHKLREIASQA